MLDPATGRRRRTWAFVMTFSWSRHQYVELVFDQKVSTWLLRHRRPFESFGGVPPRLVIDNLKVAVTRASIESVGVTETAPPSPSDLPPFGELSFGQGRDDDAQPY